MLDWNRGGGGDLGGLVLPHAVGEAPRVDVEGDGLGLLELVIGQELAGLLEPGLGLLLVVDAGGLDPDHLGTGLGDRLGQLGRGLVEEAPLDRHLLDLGDDPGGLVVVAQAHLLAGRLELPPGVLLEVGGPPGPDRARGGGVRGGRRRCGRRGGLDGGVGRGGLELGQVIVELGLLARSELIAILAGHLEVLRGATGVTGVEESDTTLEVVDGRGGQGRPGRRIGRVGCVLSGRAFRGGPPRAEGQDDRERFKPSQRDLLSPLPGTTADFPGGGLGSESPGRET